MNVTKLDTFQLGITRQRSDLTTVTLVAKAAGPLDAAGLAALWGEIRAQLLAQEELAGLVLAKDNGEDASLGLAKCEIRATLRLTKPKA